MDAHVIDDCGGGAGGHGYSDAGLPAFLGATSHTNNTGELTGLIEGMLWALEHDTHTEEAVLLRPDNELAIGWTIGDLVADTNAELVATARSVYEKLLQQRKPGRVYRKHVKGHSGHIRNDHADHLANVGATLSVWDAVVPREAWRATRGDGELLQNEGGWDVGHNAQVRTTIEATPGGWRVRQCAELSNECVGWVIRPGHAPWGYNERASDRDTRGGTNRACGRIWPVCRAQPDALQAYWASTRACRSNSVAK
jgi:ribonuclease HI